MYHQGSFEGGANDMPTFNQYGNYPYGTPYQPYGVNPNMYQNNGYGQQVQQQPQQPQPQMNQYAFVNGIEGAKSFQMQPNQTILLMDSESPTVFMKTSNNLGQSSLKYYRLTEISEQELRGNNQPNVTPNKEYVLKSDFDSLVKRMDDLSRKIEKPNKNEKNNEKVGN